MKPLKTPHSQSSLDKKEQSWKHHVPRFQTILQSCSNQNYGTGVKNGCIDQWNRIECSYIERNRNKLTHI